jgi:calcium-dependent protein kinase
VEINIEEFIKISEQPITEYYEFKEKIGEGSFGNVYRAICKTSNEERAIKVLKKKQMSK